MSICNIDLEQCAYPVHYQWQADGPLEALLDSLGADRVAVITDGNVRDLHAARLVGSLRTLPVDVFVVPPGEEAKSLQTVSELCEACLRAGATRQTIVLALGGGVVGNIAGMVAGLLFRGIRLVHLPTTMVAAFDSVISLKQAVNALHSKNAIGLYRRPEAVVIDFSALTTLPPREVRSGKSEMLKNALAIMPEALDETVTLLQDDRWRREEPLERLLHLAIAAKLKVMRADAFEKHDGLVLEYGHTVGHAIELADTRRRGVEGISHGEAVATGMMIAARIANKMSIADATLVERHRSAMDALDLAGVIPDGLDADEIFTRVAKDNKRGYLKPSRQYCSMVLLSDIGKPVYTSDLPLVSVPTTLLVEEIAHG